MSQTDRGRISHLEQTDCSVVPATPTWQVDNVVSASLSYQKQTVESGILDSSAQPTDTVKVGASSSGSLSIEWAALAFEDFLEAGVRGTYDNVVADVGTHGIVKSTRTLTATGAFTNAIVGQWLLLSGFVAGESYAGAGDSTNNGWFEIETKTSADAVVLKDPRARLLDETGPLTAAVNSKMLINGVEERCFAIEQSLLDVDSHFVFLGQRLNTFSMSVTAGQIVTGDVGFMGSGAMEETGTTPPSWSTGATYTPALQNASLNATSNVGDIIIDGDISTSCFRTLTLTVNNNLRETPCIGLEFPRIDYGTPTCTGSFEKVYTDSDLWRKMRDHETVAMEFGLIEGGGIHGIHVSVPEVFLNTDGVDLSGGRNSDVYDKVDWSASKHTNQAGSTYYIQICVA